MKHGLLMILIAALVIPLGIVGAQTDDATTCASVALLDAHALPTDNGETTILGTFVNLADEAAALIDVWEPGNEDAETIELRGAEPESDDVILRIPPGGSLELTSDGVHLVATGLADELAMGDTLRISFGFDSLGALAGIQLPVRDAMDMSMDMQMNQNPMMSGDLLWLGQCDGVRVVDAWARPSVAPTSAAYGYVLNFGLDEITLTGGASPAAEAVELHTMTIGEGDVMMMEPIDGITITRVSWVRLQPGGLHVMLIGLDDMLEDVDTLDLTLNLAEGDPLELQIPVEDRAGGMDDMDMDDESGMGGMGNMLGGGEADAAEDCAPADETAAADDQEGDCIIDLSEMMEDE